MYEQHPVPQQISSYSFKLVGDMTLKQFFEIAGGAVVALIIYSLPILGLVKWPLVVASALSGAAFAFLPIQDRPLEQWLTAFFRSIYSPSVYVWRRSTKPHIYFQPEGTPQPQVAPAAVMQQVAAIPEKPSEPEYITQLDNTEEQRLKEISTLMDGSTPPQQTQPAEQVVVQMQAPAVQQTPQPQPTQAPAAPAPVIVPREEKTEMKNEGYEEVEQHVPQQAVTSDVKQVLSTSDNGALTKAQFSTDAAPPTPPEKANLLVGQVMDSAGKIIEGAILEIKDKQGRPVRALKTNRAGHFMIVTSLADGEYKLITEKDGFIFKPIEVVAKGQIIDPIAIRAEKG